jgi:AAA domain-containing protein
LSSTKKLTPELVHSLPDHQVGRLPHTHPDPEVNRAIGERLRLVATPGAKHEPHSWKPIDLGAIEPKPPRRPSMCGSLFTAGARHLLSGEPEGGKSLLALAACVVELRAGNNVVWIDRESDPDFVAERLRCFGVSREEAARFAYIQPVDRVTSPGVAEAIAGLLNERKPTQVVFDAFAGLLDLHDLDGIKTTDVERGNRLIIEPWRQSGAATIVIDHVVKAKGDRGRFAIGSERKLGAVDVHIGLETIEPLGRGRCGRVKVLIHKDRFGFLPRPRFGDFVLESDEAGILTACRFESATDDPFRPTVLMQRVSDELERHDEPVTRQTVKTNVKGKDKFVIQAIDCLIQEGHVGEQAGERGSRLLSLIKPFPAEGMAGHGSEGLSTVDLCPMPRVYNAGMGMGHRAVPLIGEPNFLVELRHRRQHLTDKEWQERRALHKLVERARAAA